MFYALLELVACPVCRAALVLLDPHEQPQRTTMRLAPAERLSPPGALVGPLPTGAADTPTLRLLAPLAAAPAPAGRDREVSIVHGILLCVGCGRWFPVRGHLPELLPDHLRDWSADRAWLLARQPRWAAPELAALWAHLTQPGQPAGGSTDAEDAGAHYKHAEMAVAKRTLPEGFFAAGQIMPFVPSRPHLTLDLLARYVTTVTRLDVGMNATVLDLGVGYAWTTEWLVRLGYQAVGFDLTREYVDAGMARLGDNQPHLIVADAENLPLRAECMDATLSFDAFHHLPNRPRAMRELARVMRPGAKLVLVEPGKAHEYAAQSVAVMQQHGILERGFDQAGLAGYIADTPLGNLTHVRSDSHPHDIFVVQKAGTLETSSRAPRLLAAEISLHAPPASVAAGQSATLTAIVTNLGDTVWLNTTADEIGTVYLGAHLYDPGHTLLQENYVRVILPRPLRPDQRLKLQFALPPILRPGAYVVEWDMVDTGYLWFKDMVRQVVEMPLSVTGPAASADTPLVAARAPRIPATELEFGSQPRAVEPAATGQRLALRNVPRVVWTVLKTEGVGAVLRKGWQYLRGL